MLTIQSNRDLEQFGIVMLTGESCAYSKRILCDITQTGYKIFCKCFGLHHHMTKELNPSGIGNFSSFAEAWNSNSKQAVLNCYYTPGAGISDVKSNLEPHILSVMLPYNVWEFLGFWCLEQLQGISEVCEFNRTIAISNVEWRVKEDGLVREHADRRIEMIRNCLPEQAVIGLGTYDNEIREEAKDGSDPWTLDFYSCLGYCKLYSVKKSSSRNCGDSTGVYGSDRNQHQMSGRVA